MTSSSRRDATLERLLDGAEETFAARGYNAANVHEICARAKVGIGTFYAHFDHKRQLLRQVFVERALLFSRILTPADLLDHDRLVACLRRAIDDPTAAGMLRAWYEAVLDEPEIARFHAEWRPETLKDLAATVAKAQELAPSAGPRLGAAVVAWTMGTLTREMAIHDRKAAPDLEGLARLFEELTFGPILPVPAI
jgi:AcrR family transcriptional regulator